LSLLVFQLSRKIDEMVVWLFAYLLAWACLLAHVAACKLSFVHGMQADQSFLAACFHEGHVQHVM